MNNEVQDCINRLKAVFPKAFIYKNDELIIEPKNNIYFASGYDFGVLG